MIKFPLHVMRTHQRLPEMNLDFIFFYFFWWWWNYTWHKIVFLYFLQHFYSSDFCFSHSLYNSHVVLFTPPPCLTFRCVSLASETKRKWWVYKKRTFYGGVIMQVLYLFLTFPSRKTIHSFLNGKLVISGRTFQFSVLIIVEHLP